MTARLRPEDKGYLAGIIDGEGHIGLTRSVRKKTGTYQYGARVIVSLASKKLYDIKDILDTGSIHRVERKSEKHRAYYQWTLNSNACRSLLPDLVPLLRVKRRQAELLLDYLKVARTGNKRSDKYRQQVAAIWQRIKKLNERGPKLRRGESVCQNT